MLSNIFAQLLNLACKTSSNADLSTLEGNSFVLSIDECPQDIALIVTNQQVMALPEAQVCHADVTISGNLKAIRHMIKDEQAGLDSDELYIAGKISTAKRFQQLLSSLSLDWETILGLFLPDTVAQKGATAIEQGIALAQDSAERIGERLQTYIIEDKQFIVSRGEFQSLQQELEQFHQRLDTLLAQLSSPSAPTYH